MLFQAVVNTHEFMVFDCGPVSLHPSASLRQFSVSFRAFCLTRLQPGPEFITLLFLLELCSYSAKNTSAQKLFVCRVSVNVCVYYLETKLI